MKKFEFSAATAEKVARVFAAGIMALAIKYLVELSDSIKGVNDRLDTLQMRLDDHDLLGSDLSLRLKRLEGEIFYP